MIGGKAYFLAEFQSTLPRGERRIRHRGSVRPMEFQSTLPRGERRVLGQRFRAAQKFQSTLPRGERLDEVDKYPGASKFQSTLPRGERRIQSGAFSSITIISIHAPARGATSENGEVRGSYYHFNPRSREGSDGLCLEMHPTQTISIHAPARGATSRSGTIRTGIKFQSTLPRGERRIPVRRMFDWQAFQSTLPRGERLNQESIQ